MIKINSKSLKAFMGHDGSTSSGNGSPARLPLSVTSQKEGLDDVHEDKARIWPELSNNVGGDSCILQILPARFMEPRLLVVGNLG